MSLSKAIGDFASHAIDLGQRQSTTDPATRPDGKAVPLSLSNHRVERSGPDI